MTDQPILTEDEAIACADSRYDDDGSHQTRHVLRLLRSHEALRAELVRLTAARNQAYDALAGMSDALDEREAEVTRLREALRQLRPHCTIDGKAYDENSRMAVAIIDAALAAGQENPDE